MYVCVCVCESVGRTKGHYAGLSLPFLSILSWCCVLKDPEVLAVKPATTSEERGKDGQMCYQGKKHLIREKAETVCVCETKF